ncbi:hypothetical protein [Paraburkholderia sp. A2WS-5]
MVAGLIDADLGGNVVKRGALCLGVERAGQRQRGRA